MFCAAEGEPFELFENVVTRDEAKLRGDTDTLVGPRAASMPALTHTGSEVAATGTPRLLCCVPGFQHTGTIICMHHCRTAHKEVP